MGRHRLSMHSGPHWAYPKCWHDHETAISNVCRNENSLTKMRSHNQLHHFQSSVQNENVGFLVHQLLRFENSDSRGLSHAWGTSVCRALCDCAATHGVSPVSPIALIQICRVHHQNSIQHSFYIAFRERTLPSLYSSSASRRGVMNLFKIQSEHRYLSCAMETDSCPSFLQSRRGGESLFNPSATLYAWSAVTLVLWKGFPDTWFPPPHFFLSEHRAL